MIRGQPLKFKRRKIMATFTNKATLSYNGGSTDSNTVTGVFQEALSATKTPLETSYEIGQRVVYVLSLINSGASSLSGVNIADDLGAFDVGGNTVYPLDYDGIIAYYINGILQPVPTVSSEKGLNISGISVPAGGNATIIYETIVNAFAPPMAQGTITNTATITGNGIPEPVLAVATISTLDAPVLSITKALSPTSVGENGEITYTLTIQNSGNTPAVATDNLVVSDIFDPVLDISSVTLNGTPLVQGTDYTYNEASGEFATNIGVITLPEATYTPLPDGSYSITPATATLVIVGTI